MIKILFICHGNICRSVSAQYIMEDLAKKNGVELYVSSAATSREEIGNDIYSPAKRKLKEKGVPFSRHYARQATMSDYLSYDYLICMDENNMRNLNRMFNNDPDHKIYNYYLEMFQILGTPMILKRLIMIFMKAVKLGWRNYHETESTYTLHLL